MSADKILVIGSYNVDLTAAVKQFPKPGETIFGSKFSKGLGGKGANQAIAAARAGGAVAFAGRVGFDSFGEEAVEKLASEGIDTGKLRKDASAPTGTALILVNEAGENQIVVVSGANYQVTPEDISEITDLAAYKWLLVQMELPFETVKAAVIAGKQTGCSVILNPAPAAKAIRELLPYIDVLTPNQHEAELLTGIPVETEADAEKAAAALLESGVQNVIITLGSKGVYYAGGTGQNRVGKYLPAFRVDAVDSTGAGDCFNGALTAALAEGNDMGSAIRFAQAAASLSVTRAGAGDAMPFRAEIEVQTIKLDS